MKLPFLLLTATILAHSATAQQAHITGPHLLIYKTKANYRKLVPVILSADKKTIVSYPDPTDIKAGGDKILPVSLHKGYLLDNRGINENVAFLKFTYAQYAQLSQAPTQDELYNKILIKDPLTTLYDCGAKASYKNPKTALNQLIDKNELHKKCKQIK